MIPFVAHSQLRSPAADTEYIVAARFSSVLLSGHRKGLLPEGTLIRWSVLVPDRRAFIVIHTMGSTEVRLSEFYIQKIHYNMRDGSIELKNADLADEAIYENTITTFGTSGNRTYYDKILKVQDVLQPPMMFQNPNSAINIIHLHCVVKNEEVSTVWWMTEGKQLENNATYKMSIDNKTLTINTERHLTCQLYTCVVRNDVSENRNSRLIVLDGLLLLHEFCLLSSVIALVSTSTSYGAAVFILFFALETYRVHKRHVQLTAAFVFSQMISFISVLIASLFCVLDSGFPVAYRVVEGIAFGFIAAMVTYILFLYLRPETQLKRSFLVKKKHRNLFLVFGVLAMIMSAIPIYKANNNMRSWTKVRRLSRLASR
ncbi:uncharacterized protein [Heterodontus francisci]|uniref:uncharacterized protein isoform X1 n=1 Tax=Heterodontus francisci TaxID=7792 RepID=UPI00355C4212